MRLTPLRKVLVTLFSVVFVDQATKYVADVYVSPLSPIEVLPFLQLVNVKNKGAAFGMLSGLGNPFFIIISVLAIVLVVYMLTKCTDTHVSLSLILGGAVGNLIDRLIYGHVRDFIDVYVSGYHWPAFNVADSALTVGMALLLLASFRRKSNCNP